MTRLASGLMIDYGQGFVDEDGAILAGPVGITYSDLQVTPSRITGSYTVDATGFLRDGRAPLVETVTGSMDLTVDPSGHAADTVLATHVWYGRGVGYGYFLERVFPDSGWQYTELPNAAGYQQMDLILMGPGIDFSKVRVILSNYTCEGENSVVFDHQVLAHDCHPR